MPATKLITAKLAVESGPLEGTFYPLVDGMALCVGSGRTAHLRFDDPEVAPEQFEIEAAGDSFKLCPMVKKPATLVNGQPIEQLHDLTDSDVIEVGPFRMRLVRYRQAPAESSGKDRSARQADRGAEPFRFPDQRVSLRVETGSSQGSVHDLDEKTNYVIGRSSKSDVQVVEEAVSRHHCMLVWKGNTLWLEDLRSANGTFLNSTPVDNSTSLQPGDVITVGAAAFVVEAEDPQEDTAGMLASSAPPTEDANDAEELEELRTLFDSGAAGSIAAAPTSPSEGLKPLVDRMQSLLAELSYCVSELSMRVLEQERRSDSAS
ncbi:FHA domain-containing protein [Planctomycetota bacterium]